MNKLENALYLNSLILTYGVTLLTSDCEIPLKELEIYLHRPFKGRHFKRFLTVGKAHVNNEINIMAKVI